MKQCFKVNIINSSSNDITSQTNILKKMLIQVVTVCDWAQRFPNIDEHRFQVEPEFQDDHLTQILKIVSIKYLTMRLQAYGNDIHGALSISFL